MKKLTIKSIIDFRRKSDNSKKTFIANLKGEKEKTSDDGGGDYWITSLSAISNAFKKNDIKYIKDKIDELVDKHEVAEYKRTKTMHQRNIDILHNYEDVDFKKWLPSSKITFLKKHKADSILTIKGVQVQANPHHVFTLEKNGVKEIGGIWFIAKLGGFREDELGMFTDILFRYLKVNFSNDYTINPKYCIAVDVVTIRDINYDMLKEKKIPKLLNKALSEIITLL